jgi:hypothetical protein
MDDSEKVAYKYLTQLEFKRVQFEPEGKSKPPDFLADDRVAVEVRRLNQNEVPSQPGMKQRGLEEVAIPVQNDIQRLLPSLGPPAGQVSWYVDIKYSRPVPGRRQIEDAVRQHLQAFRASPIQDDPTRIRLFDNFMLKLFRAGRPYPDYFVMAGCSDHDSGGWVIPELERNLKICIDEKTAKVSGIRTKYAEWWLALIDHINYGAKEAIQIPPHDWDKIILINPLNHTQAFEVR